MIIDNLQNYSFCSLDLFKFKNTDFLDLTFWEYALFLSYISYFGGKSLLIVRAHRLYVLLIATSV